MINVTILNGPPSCGKDYAVKQLIAGGNLIEHCSFKRRLHEIGARVMDISDESWSLNYELIKDCPDPSLRGKTIRDLMIAISEDLVKPLFGRDHFGKLELERIKKIAQSQFFSRDFVFTDGGFIEEAQVFADDPNVNLVVIQVKRDGCSFDGDSRSYIHPHGANVYQVVNFGDECFKEEIKNILERERVSEESFCKN